MPTATDADGLVELLAHDSGAAHFGCWCLLVRIAARCKPRGVLMRDSGRPHTAQSLALLSRIPAEIWEQAIPRFVEIGWASYAEPKTDHASITVDAGPSVIEARADRGMTHDREERREYPSTCG
jgi:hypothetical protein